METVTLVNTRWWRLLDFVLVASGRDSLYYQSANTDKGLEDSIVSELIKLLDIRGIIIDWKDSSVAQFILDSSPLIFRYKGTSAQRKRFISEDGKASCSF